ncbi:insulinase family protein [Halomonas shantousis]
MTTSRARISSTISFPELPAGSRVAVQCLDNGLQLLAAEVPSARQVRLVGAVGTGYLDEPEALPGLAHLLEHALFLGSRNAPAPGAFAAWIGERGGRYNARTDEYVTDVHLTLPLDAARAGLTRLVELLLYPCLDEGAVAREVDVLDAEFQARLADPALHRQAVLSRLCRDMHPAHACHAGNRASLGSDALGLCAQMAEFHSAHYRAERMSLVMLGPMPLEEQMTWLVQAGAEIPAGAGALPPRRWRWKAPAHLQWCLPETLPTRAATLEMLWPFPPDLMTTRRASLERLTAGLGDGTLAQTLQHEGAIADLSVSLAAPATDTALSLSLSLSMTEAGSRCVETLLATCRAAVREQVERVLRPSKRHPGGVIAPQALDAWPLVQARRLARGLLPGRHVNATPTSDETLREWLAPSQCRVLEERASLTVDSEAPFMARVRYVPQTLTAFRKKADTSGASPFMQGRPLPLRSAPVLAVQTPIVDAASRAPGLVENDPIALWWGNGPEQPGASWCLGWPASVSRQPERLAAWRRHALALRQACQAQGVLLWLEGDARGDWLMARGPAERLASAIEQVLAAWPEAAKLAADTGPSRDGAGLLAQRLLTYLERPSRHVTQATRKPRALAWISGGLGVSEARAGCRCLKPQLAALAGWAEEEQDQSAAAVSSLHWLAPQADDHALMLQVDAADDSPMSRVLMQLLGGCHDAAFFNEMREKRRLGYVAAVRYREAGGWPRLGYVIQSPHAGIDELKQAITDFIVERAVALARLDVATLRRRCVGLRATLETPETLDATLVGYWQALRASHGRDAATINPFEPPPWVIAATALETLTIEHLTAHAEALTNGELRWQWWAHAPRRA